jgi:site-specific DNA recombinase
MSKINNIMRKKIIGYVRVSSLLQMEKDNSINNQINFINEYCKRNDYELIDIFEDGGISGLKDREGIEGLIKFVKDKKVDGVVVYSLSRLDRRLKKVIEIIELFEKNKIEFISIKENLDLNNLVGKLMLNLLGSINEFEVSQLGERISDVKRYKKSINKVYGGKILFGKYRRKDNLINNINEIKILKLIKKLREEDKMSYFRISKYLNNDNIKSKEKGIWYGNSVRSVYLNGVLERS